MLISAWSRTMQSSHTIGAGGQLDREKFVLSKCMLVEDQDLAALLGMAEDQPEDRAIGRVGDRQPDDLDPLPLKRTNTSMNWPTRFSRKTEYWVTVGRFDHGAFPVRLRSAIILAKAHEGPRAARSTAGRNYALPSPNCNNSKVLRSMAEATWIIV